MQSQVMCSGCRTILLYPRGAGNVCCAVCYALLWFQPMVAHVNCGNCCITLMYPFGAPSVKCTVCHFVTNVNMGNARVPIPAQRPGGTATSAANPSIATAPPRSQSQKLSSFIIPCQLTKVANW